MDKKEIDKAYAIFSESVTTGGQKVECVVGYQGGSETATLTWHPDKGFWALLEPDRIENRFWCAFGTASPVENALVSITCEINPPRSGCNRQCAGLFISDSAGAIHLAHSGKVGGGRAGVGKSAFLGSRNKNDLVPVRFPDEKETEYVVIGRIDDDDFLAELAAFVYAVEEFKRDAATAKK